MVKPYYESGGIVLYHGNCREVLPLLPSAEVLVMDPPFDSWDSVPFASYTRSLVAFTGWQHRREVEDVYGQPRSEVVWYFRDGRWVSHKLPRQTHEIVMVYGETGESYVGDATDGVARSKGRGCVGKDRLAERVYVPRARKALDSVQCYPRNVSSPLGVWQKPLPLVTRLLEWVGGSVVTDPFCGAGTTLVAARALGMKAIGIEVDEAHCEIAAKRLSQEVLL